MFSFFLVFWFYVISEALRKSKSLYSMETITRYLSVKYCAFFSCYTKAKCTLIFIERINHIRLHRS